MALGERIKSQRLAHGLTQQALAKQIGVKRVTIATYERGQVAPSLTIVRRLAAVFDMSIEDLVEDRDEETTD